MQDTAIAREERDKVRGEGGEEGGRGERERERGEGGGEREERGRTGRMVREKQQSKS